MRDHERLSQLYIHESVSNVIPQDAFTSAFDETPIEVELVGDEKTYGKSDAVATYVPREAFLEAGWVHCIRAGYDAFDTNAYEEAGVPLTNSTGIHGSTVGELALSFMLSFARLTHRYREHQTQSHWWTPPYERPFTIENERVCVVGLGTIGEAIATRCDALGMTVTGVRRSDDPVPGVTDLVSPNRLHEAIEDARFVVLTVPHTPTTEGMLSDAEFELMREDAYVVNVARGPVVDEDALITALEENEIAGAGLDVFETEPLPEDSPLWDLDEVLISPHKGSATNRYHLDIASLIKENIRRYQSDDSLKNRVA
ncbi:2-D-hydroxyacid dehydrogenase [Natrialba chahannaoensis JCM 10990]|uniref:2-D-hydroxyacid dehydrogenase n=1 Tax=Natrialba chahannaoensis JCM 10990 TaxID=1227492 RepID=M0B2Y0_9EURY|nr:D-2-hydroxyacid dehydrogenase [Natrialba chahannaoensis]ELZ04912.1 2-D-hydroxyacid dehydrogenase [Natrialba chahannaoensis JCM 10990]